MESLPLEVFELIVKLLPTHSLLSLRCCSSGLRALCRATVRSLCLRTVHDLPLVMIWKDVSILTVSSIPASVNNDWGIADLRALCVLHLEDVRSFNDETLCMVGSQLRTLSIVGLSMVEGTSFAVMGGSLQSLSLVRNSSVDGRNLHHLSVLQMLNLQCCGPGVFAGHLVCLANTLKTLDLSENVHVEGWALLSLVRLQELSLWGNGLVQDEHLVHLSELTRLNLRANNVISGTHLAPTLHSLNLRNNNTFTNRSLEIQTALEELDVRVNHRIDLSWFQLNRPRLKKIVH